MAAAVVFPVHATYRLGSSSVEIIHPVGYIECERKYPGAYSMVSRSHAMGPDKFSRYMDILLYH